MLKYYLAVVLFASTTLAVHFNTTKEVMIEHANGTRTFWYPNNLTDFINSEYYNKNSQSSLEERASYSVLLAGVSCGQYHATYGSDYVAGYTSFCKDVTSLATEAYSSAYYILDNIACSEFDGSEACSLVVSIVMNIVSYNAAFTLGPAVQNVCSELWSSLINKCGYLGASETADFYTNGVLSSEGQPRTYFESSTYTCASITNPDPGTAMYCARGSDCTDCIG